MRIHDKFAIKTRISMAAFMMKGLHFSIDNQLENVAQKVISSLIKFTRELHKTFLRLVERKVNWLLGKVKSASLVERNDDGGEDKF